MNFLSDNDKANPALYAYSQIPRQDEDEDFKEDFKLNEIIDSIDDSAAIKRHLEEPNFHKDNKSLCMKIFPALAKRTNLSIKEIEFYYRLKTT